jgi:hypothetical protein
MDIESFIEHSPFLYHLTCEQNAKNIINTKKLFSANVLIDMSENSTYLNIKNRKRFDHKSISVKGIEVFLRDQRPISELALSKCLTNNWAVGDFLFYLNARVFMWPNINRLQRHFNRYADEKPVIFRFSSKDILNENPTAKFSRLNSGATRANSYLGGKAPARGINTFLPFNEYNMSPSTVAEVTFENYCIIPENFSIKSNPLEFE